MTNKTVTLTYSLSFYSEWHCGSGLAAGADVDALVVKDRDGLPYVPGKTIKGLVREAVETIIQCSTKGNNIKSIKKNCTEIYSCEEIYKMFAGVFGNGMERSWNIFSDEKVKGEGNESMFKTKFMKKGMTFFSNAEFDPSLRALVLSDKDFKRYLYRSVSFTAIDEDGIAEKHSLRKIETTIPCKLTGKIIDIPEEFVYYIVGGLHFIKRLGLNRNRGLGRCDFKIIEPKEFEITEEKI